MSGMLNTRVLWSEQVELASGANKKGAVISHSGLHLVGTSATGMTIEFSAAGATHTIQVVNGCGYDTK